MFQHTAARRRLAIKLNVNGIYLFVSTHSRPKAAGCVAPIPSADGQVSTHSRPKAAGPGGNGYPFSKSCFNTQPPEGGWCFETFFDHSQRCFNTQPPEGGWCCNWECQILKLLFQHTAARRRLGHSDRRYKLDRKVSTHSRPKAAGSRHSTRQPASSCFNTQPPEGGWLTLFLAIFHKSAFQHTAARRRLAHKKQETHLIQ